MHALSALRSSNCGLAYSILAACRDLSSSPQARRQPPNALPALQAPLEAGDKEPSKRKLYQESPSNVKEPRVSEFEAEINKLQRIRCLTGNPGSSSTSRQRLLLQRSFNGDLFDLAPDQNSWLQRGYIELRVVEIDVTEVLSRWMIALLNRLRLDPACLSSQTN